MWVGASIVRIDFLMPLNSSREAAAKRPPGLYPKPSIHGLGCLIVECLVRPLSIVKTEVRREVVNSVRRIAVVLEINVFVFHGPPEPFHKNIVQRTAPAVHTDQDVFGLESAGECLAGKLRALVGVEDFRGTLTQRAIQRRAAESRVETRRYFPTEHVPAEPIHDGNQVNEARSQPDIGDVAGPHLVGVRNDNVAQPVRINSMTGRRR